MARSGKDIKLICLVCNRTHGTRIASNCALHVKSEVPNMPFCLWRGDSNWLFCYDHGQANINPPLVGFWEKSVSDILVLVIYELDFALLVQGNFVIFKLVNIFLVSPTFTINQQNKYAFGLIPGQYCLVSSLHLLLTALLAGKQLYKNHMLVLFQTPCAHNQCSIYENVYSPLVFFHLVIFWQWKWIMSCSTS